MWTSMNFPGELESECKNPHEDSKQRDKEFVKAMLLTLCLTQFPSKISLEDTLHVYERTTQKGSTTDR